MGEVISDDDVPSVHAVIDSRIPSVPIKEKKNFIVTYEYGYCRLSGDDIEMHIGKAILENVLLKDVYGLVSNIAWDRHGNDIPAFLININ